MSHDQAKLPTENAHEPEEEACQPSSMLNKGRVTFADNNDSPQKKLLNCNNKDLLSQPPPALSHKQRLQWLQDRRGIGLWVQCDSCDSWRYMPHAQDSNDLPAVWYCNMNPDPNYANCFVPEVPLQICDEEDLIHAEYSAGSVVWARLTGWPWWPAMVDDCPDTEQFYWLDGLSDIPTYYNVVFFDTHDVTRAWISPRNLKHFTISKKSVSKDKKYKKRLDVAVKQANDANSLSLSNRLAKYSFISRFKGQIHSPKRINRNDLRKYRLALKRKFNVEFPIYSSDSDTDIDTNLDESVKQKVNKAYTNLHKVVNAKKCKKNTNNKQKKINKLASDQNIDIVANGLQDNEPNVETSTNCSSKDDPIPDSLILNNGKSSNECFKQQNSVSDFGNVTEDIGIDKDNTSALDNDSSATYIPSTLAETESIFQSKNTLEVCASPCSDDFDF